MPSANVFPNFLFAPIEQRTHLMETVLTVPLDAGRQGTARRLAAPDTRDPGAPARKCTPKRLDLADAAAPAPLLQPLPETVDAVCTHPFLERFRLRIVESQFAREALLEAAH